MKVLETCGGVVLWLGLVSYAYAQDTELSRVEAAEIIRKSDLFSTTYGALNISERAFDQGVQRGFWDHEGNVEPEIVGRFLEVSRTKINLATPYTIRPMITGITDALEGEGALKRVEFRWQYADLPPLASVFARNGGTGYMNLRLYDDGWRATDRYVVQYSNELFNASQAALSLAEKLREQIRVRKRKEAEGRAALKQNVRRLQQLCTRRRKTWVE